MRTLALVLLLSGATHAGEAAGAEGNAALSGAWKAVAAQQDGAPAPNLIGHRLVFTGDKFTIFDAAGGLLYAGTYTLGPAVPPAQIDFHGTAAADKGQTWEGIYRQQDDALTIVDDAPDPAKGRPSEFAAPAGSGYVMIEFQRLR
jgi:uncharacterized protein (TIGR03067 family)